MKTVNNKERALFTRGQLKPENQEKDNKSKNAILLLLLIDGILIAYFFTLLDGDEILPASDDTASLPDLDTDPDIAAAYFLDLEGRHPPLPSRDKDTTLHLDLKITGKNRISTPDPPQPDKLISTPSPPDVAVSPPDVAISPRPEIVSPSNPEPLPPDLVPEINTSDPEITTVVTETDINPEDQGRGRDVILIDNDDGDLVPDDLVPEIDEILSVVLIPVASGGDDDGYLRPVQDEETPEDQGETPSGQENTDNADTRNNEEGDPGGEDETRPDSDENNEQNKDEQEENGEDNELDGEGEETEDNDPAENDDAENDDDEDNSDEDDTDETAHENNPEDLINEAPEITSGATAPSLAENAEVSASTAVYTATGTYDLTSITWSLSGTDDDALFEVGASSGEVRFRAATTPDYEAKDTYTFTVRATSGSETAEQVVTVAVTDVDEAPGAMDLSPASVRIAEGVTAARKLSDITFTDDALGTNGASVNAVLVGGKALFEVRNSTELWLVAGVDLDHEAATSHVVTVTPNVTGTGQDPDPQTFTLEVRDVNEAPEITSGATAPSLAENAEVSAGTAVYTATGTYDLTSITWSLSGTDDDALFEVGASSGEVRFKAATTPDYEAKDTYTFTVRATSGSETAEQVVTVAVTDVDEAPAGIQIIPLIVTVKEGRTSGVMTLATITYTDDALGTNTPTLTIRSEGISDFDKRPNKLADDDFQIVSTTDEDGDVIRNSYDVQIKDGVLIDGDSIVNGIRSLIGYTLEVNSTTTGTGEAPDAETFNLVISQVALAIDKVEVPGGWHQ